MQQFDPRRRHYLAAMSALAAAGCAGPGFSGAAAGPPQPAPVYRVGDRWAYACKDGYRLPETWTETHTVVAVNQQGIDIDVTLEGSTMHSRRVEHLLSPGIVTSGSVYDNQETRNFTEPLTRYQYPLTPGSSWKQGVRNLNPENLILSTIQRSVSVEGYESVTVPAGTFNALKMNIIMSVDDNSPFFYPAYCAYQLWWAAEAGAMVRETKYSTYIERGGEDSAATIAQNITMELATYRLQP